jgi:predicted AAA+ superfamily ATPase
MIRREKYISKIENILDMNKSIFLVWARQVWKTSLMKYVKNNLEKSKKSFYLNFDEIATSSSLKFNNLWEFINYINIYFETFLNQQKV